MRILVVVLLLSLLLVDAKNYFGDEKLKKDVAFEFSDEVDRDKKLSALRRLSENGITGEALDGILAEGSDKLLEYAEKLQVMSEYVVNDKTVNDGNMEFLGDQDDKVVVESSRLMMSEEEYLGMAHLCRIHTYVSNPLDKDQTHLLALWMRNWYSLGIRPKVLRRTDGSVFMMERMPPSYGSDLQWYETDAFVRWMTLFSHGGGVMTDPDVFGMSYDMPLVDQKKCYQLPSKVKSHSDFPGGVVMGSRMAINRYAQDLIQIGHEEMEARRAMGKKLLISDKQLAKKHTSRLFQFQEDFPGLIAFNSAKIIEESRLTGKKLGQFEWANDLLRLNSLNRNRIEIVIPQDTVLRSHPLRTMMEHVKCPASDGTHGWKPVMPSSLLDIETILPVSEAQCHIGVHFDGSYYSEVKPVNPPNDGNSRGRRTKEVESFQKRKLMLVIEDPVASAWNRIGAKRPMTKPNPITRFFFGESSLHLNSETFNYQTFNHEVAQLISRLEREDFLTVILLDADQSGPAGKHTRLVLEYALGYMLPEDKRETGAERKAPNLKMDRSWRSRFEDDNQADYIFYVIARAHYERRVKQAVFLDKQLIASTTELENKMVKMEL